MKLKTMTEDQLRKIISNQYRGDPKKGFGKDYGVDEDAVNDRLWELQNKKMEANHEADIEEYNNCPQ